MKTRKIQHFLRKIQHFLTNEQITSRLKLRLKKKVNSFNYKIQRNKN